MISIIIPALNEEKEIPFLLKSIKKQSFKKDYEIIIADNSSSDRRLLSNMDAEYLPGEVRLREEIREL